MRGVEGRVRRQPRSGRLAGRPVPSRRSVDLRQPRRHRLLRGRVPDHRRHTPTSSTSPWTASASPTSWRPATGSRGQSFEQWRDRIKADNAGLPGRFDYGGRYTFNAPDGRKIAIWLELTGQKYTPRVVDLAEPIESYTTLPLVSGEFLRAPGGHEGLIEIWHPAPPIRRRDAGLPGRHQSRSHREPGRLPRAPGSTGCSPRSPRRGSSTR